MAKCLNTGGSGGVDGREVGEKWRGRESAPVTGEKYGSTAGGGCGIAADGSSAKQCLKCTTGFNLEQGLALMYDWYVREYEKTGNTAKGETGPDTGKQVL